MYQVGNVPTDPKDLPRFLATELQQIAREIATVQAITLQTLYAAPARIYEGMVVKADGTVWDPGSGAGLYARIGGVWVSLGGGTSGGGNSVTVTVDFGASFTDKAQTVVTGQAWVAAGTELVGNVFTPAGTDPDEMYLLGMRVEISDIVAGVGFTVTVYSETEAKGTYNVHVIGV
jgi:hypothetical protein